MKRVEIFKSGTHRSTDGTEATYSDQTLRVTAAAYDPAIYKAPICIGHPQTDTPAYGWVQALEFSGGVLRAWVDEVEPTFAEAVAKGRYRNVSSSFWRPAAPGNPKPGVLYLRHVGFLGAAAPAVKGLATASFASADEGTLSFTGEDGRATLADMPGIGDELARARDALASAEVRGFCDRLLNEGRLVPGLRGMAEALLFAAPTDGAVSFAEEDGGQVAGQRQALMKFLALMPKAVHFGEFAPETGEDAAASGGVAFNLPAGYAVDPERAELLAEADRVAARDKLSFAEAVRKVAAR
jgi:hypothetical protein